ncbi:magnesium/cobalt transporter CorA [Bacillus sp. CECT 9360]|uniref:magnesium/cobalt transporter CorA n=1 Tax=Bacillus sp. CECT 9360 TaxID=2845821 RepID=UPI001E5430FE|nr:magnesium/cobalt transporter CorA [Bacillus sp. CECT 9360]CAH0344124.1 Cobalt/magnesium transport protein CorA [Bacillus sp. CECT 9360]
MIRTFAVMNDLKVMNDLPLNRLSDPDVKWYWVDFDAPTEEEAMLLKTHFDFHPLAIEDCLQFLQRPKLDYYDGYDFFVLHTLNQVSLTPEEVDVFVGENFIVTFHLSASPEMQMVHQRLMEDDNSLDKGTLYVFYLIMDKIVDEFFPNIYKIEDDLNEFETKEANKNFIEGVFELRSQLLKMRRTIFPMRELVYRILNSERVIIPKEERVYFMDIHDHLLKLSEMIESNREMTTDIRDSYISLNSNRMNAIMKTLTVMTSIFIPLTFIASIYGMNFEYMPELTWHRGYFGVLGVMLVVGLGMLIWLWRKGWFK